MPANNNRFKAAFVILAATGLGLASFGSSNPAQAADGNWRIDEIAQASGVFSDEERRIILDVLEVATGTDMDGRDRKSKGGYDHKGNGNKGKGNKGLPPGIAMNLERGGTLPPGIAKRNLPADLRARLPYRSDGALRRIVGNDVALIRERH